MIICCGEALIDMVPETLANGESSYVPRSGGAVFNTAVAIAASALNAHWYPAFQMTCSANSWYKDLNTAMSQPITSCDQTYPRLWRL